MRDIYKISKIVEDSMKDLSIESLNFVRIELLFRLCERINITDKVDMFYSLLSRSDIIYESHFSKENYLLANAKKLFKTFNHSKVYRDVLKEYISKSNSSFCLYRVEDNKLFRNDPKPLVYEDREADYDNLLDTNLSMKLKNRKSADYENLYYALSDGHKLEFPKFEKFPISSKESVKRTKSNNDIVITLNELLKGADKLDEFEGKNYRRKILESNIFYTREGKKQKAKNFNIKGVINVAGQVASGKSTYAEALTVAMMDKKYRIVMIQPTVDDVLKKSELFDSMGYKTVPLIGNGSKMDHIINQMKGKDFLPQYPSSILQQPCYLNALIPSGQHDFHYGKEPCKALFKMGKYDENGNEKKDTNRYVCPYYNRCPKTRLEREIESSDIVITTLDGYAHINFGRNNKNFMVYSITNFDLIIFDEIDNVVCKLDEIFAPSLKVNEFLTKSDSVKYLDDFRLEKFDRKTGTDVDKKSFIFELDRFHNMMVVISGMVRDERSGWPKSYLKSFSAFSLLYKLKREDDSSIENTLSDFIWNSIYDLINPKNHNESYDDLMLKIEHPKMTFSSIEDSLSTIIVSSIIKKEFGYSKKMSASTNDNTERYRREDELKVMVNEEFNELSNKLKQKLLFILRVLAFEQLYRSLSTRVDSIEDVPTEIREIINTRFTHQQNIMPNSPIGNIFAIEIREDDLYIKKQFAFGRAAAMKVPYLVLGPNGEPLGANVLLLSGTGYIPGSVRFHVSDIVDYVIEAEKSKRDFIAQSKMINLKSTISVSGILDEGERNKNLRNLIRSIDRTIISCVRNNEKILMITNSYSQCKIAEEEITKILSKHHMDYEAYALQPDNDFQELDDLTENRTVPRRDITSFDKGILVAPACVIERGYNIVDHLGNAWFDTVIFLVRPLTNPVDYNIHVQKVNGYIMNRFSNFEYTNRIDVVNQIRKEAHEKYGLLDHKTYGIADLTDEMKKDVVATLFVTIEQIFGRLCRLGSHLKDKYPKIYWADGAFNASSSKGFDTLASLEYYLEDIMNNSSNRIVAKTLYEPFYKALKGEG